MILVTGAAGKTGKSIVKNLVSHGIRVRSLVRSEKQAEEMTQIGSHEIVIGDMVDDSILSKAVEGVSKIYYISPNMSIYETTIGENLIKLAQQHAVQRFVYHSVLHPQVEVMPHHWQKLRMEELLINSDLDFTILQPCAYMQNILGSWHSIIDQGIYAVPYPTTARLSIVDLENVAEAALNVLTELTHSHAIYELSGPEPLSQVEVAAVLSRELGRTITASEIDRGHWAENSRKSGLDEYQISTLLKMFEYYEKCGLAGNSNILEYLIKKPATNFSSFIHRILLSRLR